MALDIPPDENTIGEKNIGKNKPSGKTKQQERAQTLGHAPRFDSTHVSKKDQITTTQDQKHPL